MTSPIEGREIKTSEQAELLVSNLNENEKELVFQALKKALFINLLAQPQKESAENQKTDSDYLKVANDNVELPAIYKKDYLDPGDFVEEEGENEESLEYLFSPGMFIQGKWVKQSDTDNESYIIVLYYYNKNNIEIQLEAGYGGDEHLQSSFDFVTEIAKKHYLYNYEIANYFKIGNTPTFDEIKQMIKHYEGVEKSQRGESLQYRGGKSRSKTMTLEDAKRLMDDLGIDVKFPSNTTQKS